MFLGLVLLICHKKNMYEYVHHFFKLVFICDLYTNIMLIILIITPKLTILIIWLLIVNS